MAGPLAVALAPFLGGALRDLVASLFPDPAQRAEAEARIREFERDGTFEQRAQLAIAQGQIDTNKAEASAGAFRGGWRPAAGWVCVAALGFEFVVSPLGQWVAAIVGHPVPAPPKLDAVLFELLFALLGLGTLRTVERMRGRA